MYTNMEKDQARTFIDELNPISDPQTADRTAPFRRNEVFTATPPSPDTLTDSIDEIDLDEPTADGGDPSDLEDTQKTSLIPMMAQTRENVAATALSTMDDFVEDTVQMERPGENIDK